MQPEKDELDLVEMFIVRAPFVLSDVRAFRRNIVNVRATAGGRTWWARAGQKGQADVYAILRGGRIVEIEAKSATGDLEPEQKAWRAWCRDWDVPHLVLKAKAGEAAEQTVERWIEELRQIVEALS